MSELVNVTQLTLLGQFFFDIPDIQSTNNLVQNQKSTMHNLHYTKARKAEKDTYISKHLFKQIHFHLKGLS